MALGLGIRCVKYLLFIFNLMFLLAGIVFIVIGSIALSASHNLEVWSAGFSCIATCIITLGVIVLVIAFFGCCGAVKESYCMIIAYTISLAIIFIMQMVIGIYGMVQMNKVESSLQKALNKSMNNYSDNTQIMQAWDIVQTTFNCCGMASAVDWYGRLKVNGSSNGYAKSVPSSCCLADKRNNTQCGYNVLAQPQNRWKLYIYTGGCYSYIESKLSRGVLFIAVIALILAFVQLIGISCASCLAHEINNQYQSI